MAILPLRQERKGLRWVENIDKKRENLHNTSISKNRGPTIGFQENAAFKSIDPLSKTLIMVTQSNLRTVVSRTM